MATPHLLLNNFSTTLAAGITAIQTSISITSATGLVTPGKPIRLTIVDPADPSTIEIVIVTAVSGTTLTVTRGAESTTARIWATGSTVEMRLTAGMLDTFLGGFDNSYALLSNNIVDIQTVRSDSSKYATSLDSVILGGDSSADFGSVVVGYDNKAGSSGIAIGRAAVAPGGASITLNPGGFFTDQPNLITGRDQGRTIAIGATKRPAFRHAAHYYGYDYVQLYSDNAIYEQDTYATVDNAVRETTLLTPPLQLGDAAWPGAGVVVQHGYAIRVGTRIYVAWAYTGDAYTGGYYSSATTGATEPTWTTGLWDWIEDTEDLYWICLGTSYEFAMPDYARFTPTSVGVIARKSTPGGSVVYPQITAGPVGATTAWLAATTQDKITGDMSNQFNAVASTVGAKDFVAAISTAGTDIDCVAQIVIKGYVIESNVA